MGSATVFALRGLDFVDVNRVLGVGLDGPYGPDQVGTIISTYGELGLKRYQLEIVEGAPSPDEKLLEAVGLVRHPDPIWTVWRWLDELPAPETDVAVRVLEPSDRRQVAELQRTAWGVWEPDESHDLWFGATLGTAGFTYFGALIDDHLVSVGALCVDGDTAWAGFDATHPRLRRKRLRHELGVARLRRAAELGCDLIHGDMYYPPKRRTWRLAHRKARWLPCTCAEAPRLSKGDRDRSTSFDAPNARGRMNDDAASTGRPGRVPTVSQQAIAPSAKVEREALRERC